MDLRAIVAERLFGRYIEGRVANALQVVDDEYWSQLSGSGAGTLDRDWYEHKEGLDDALEVWRTNPLARRIVSLCSDYVVGSGLLVQSGVEWVQGFIDEFWKLNKMGRRVYQWCDELTRSGELFVVLRTDEVSGQSFVRALPAARVIKVETDPDDLEYELGYVEAMPGRVEGRRWASRTALQREQILVHYAINRPVGCVRGESDLGPCLPWLERYSEWLLNRARLNKYKTAFLWDVTITGRPGRGDTLRKKRFRYKTAPEPGSIIVHDDAEKWEAVSPKIEAWDAQADGKALRLAVAAGAGIPLHFMSEGESATKATAAEMGDPTFRHYSRRQLEFGAMLTDLLELCVRRANECGRGKTYGDLKLGCRFAPVTRVESESMAQAALLISRALAQMAQMGLVDTETATTMAMKFAGELVDVKTVMERVAKDGPVELVVPGAQVSAEGGRPEGSGPGVGGAVKEDSGV